MHTQREGAGLGKAMMNEQRVGEAAGESLVVWGNRERKFQQLPRGETLEMRARRQKKLKAPFKKIYNKDRCPSSRRSRAGFLFL